MTLNRKKKPERSTTRHSVEKEDLGGELKKGGKETGTKKKTAKGATLSQKQRTPPALGSKKGQHPQRTQKDKKKQKV